MILLFQMMGVSSVFFYFYYSPILLERIWPHILMENTQHFYLISILAMHAIVYGVGNLYYYLFYHFELPYFEQFKIEDKPWPWNKDQSQWKITFKKTYINFMVNFAIGGILAYFQTYRGVKVRTDFQSLPNYTEVISQIIFSMVLEDLGFYWIHRLLHHPYLYPMIHKQHHEYNVTISFSSEYAHPVEYVFGNLFPVTIGPNLLGSRMHFSTLLIWLAFRIIKTMHGHSGYLFPWEPFPLLPYGSHSKFHSIHHSQNQGNFGSAFIFWDVLFNTYDKKGKIEKVD